MRTPIRLKIQCTALSLGTIMALLSACAPPPPVETEEPPPITCGPGEIDKLGTEGCCQAGETPLEDGRCLTAGAQENGCAAGEVAIDGGPILGGSCGPSGVTEGMCAEGFVPDGQSGCEPILPPEPCPKGMVAIPGDTECREVAPCGQGQWGDIPVEADTEFVDASYAGANGASDGSQSRPWKNIQDGVDAASAGAIVAVAAGSYAEDVEIEGTAVRLWGKCPAQVTVVGTGVGEGGVFVKQGASGTVVRGISVQGLAGGILVSGSKDVTLAEVWVHDTEERGLDIENAFGPTGASVRSCLIDEARDVGMYMDGSTVSVEKSVIRGTRARPDKLRGRGMSIQQDMGSGVRADAHVSGSVIEGNRDVGVFISASDVTFEASVIRDTLPRESDGLSGSGLFARADAEIHERTHLKVVGSVIDGNHEAGIVVRASDATIEGVVVRKTQSNSDIPSLGIGVLNDGTERAIVDVSASLLDQNDALGLLVHGSEVTATAMVIRSAGFIGVAAERGSEDGADATVTMADSVVSNAGFAAVRAVGADVTLQSIAVSKVFAVDEMLGSAALQAHASEDGRRATLNVSSSTVDEVLGWGVYAIDSDVTATSVRVAGCRDYGVVGWQSTNVTLAGSVVSDIDGAGALCANGTMAIDHSAIDGCNGPGVMVTTLKTSSVSATATLDGTRIDGAQGVGVVAIDADVTIEKTTVSNTRPDEEDPETAHGVAIMKDGRDTVAYITDSHIDHAPHVGVANFGAHVEIESTTFECNGTDINDAGGVGAARGTEPDTLVADDNVCQCMGQEAVCQIEEQEIAAPGYSFPAAGPP